MIYTSFQKAVDQIDYYILLAKGPQSGARNSTYSFPALTFEKWFHRVRIVATFRFVFINDVMNMNVANTLKMFADITYAPTKASDNFRFP